MSIVEIRPQCFPFRRYIPKPELEAFLAEQKERSEEASKGGKEQKPEEGKDVGQG
jgi:hypothetical protein